MKTLNMRLNREINFFHTFHKRQFEGTYLTQSQHTLPYFPYTLFVSERTDLEVMYLLRELMPPLILLIILKLPSLRISDWLTKLICSSKILIITSTKYTVGSWRESLCEMYFNWVRCGEVLMNRAQNWPEIR